MPHVFVESNWLVDFAAPAHHQVPAAANLLDRASGGEFVLHMPNACIAEARQRITTKCQPHKETKLIRQFLSWSELARTLSQENSASTRAVLQQYETTVRRELDALDGTFQHLAGLPYFRVFALDDEMLELATKLALDGVAVKPYDHAILAGILVSSARLWDAGERGISFCEKDADLQPFDNGDHPNPPLAALYNQAHIHVCGGFTLSWPPRSPGFD